MVGQYSAYSSQVHPVFVQHSDVMELPLPVIRRRLRRVRNIVLAEVSSNQGNVTVGIKLSGMVTLISLLNKLLGCLGVSLIP